MNEIDNILEKKNIIIPKSPTPAANYIPYVTSGNIVFIAGRSDTFFVRIS